MWYVCVCLKPTNTKSLGSGHLKDNALMGYAPAKMPEPHYPHVALTTQTSIGGSRPTRQHRVKVTQCDDDHAEVVNGSHYTVTIKIRPIAAS
jgi:hypothetical protein